ncbi:MAG: glycosyltransferase family 39 protein [Chloroflexota bacterium]
MPGAAGRLSRDRLLLGAVLLLALAVRLPLWWRARGFEQGDPIEYVNIAYKIAFGIGIEWWDLRPILLPLLFVPVLYLVQAVTAVWPEPTGEAMVSALRMVSVGFGVGTVGLAFSLGRRLADTRVGVIAALLVALNPVSNQLSVSTYAELPSTLFVMLAVLFLLRGGSPAVWAGVALGVGCMIRYQAIVYVLPLGLWVLWRMYAGRALGLAVRFGTGFLLAALVQAVIELVTYGRPFHSLLQSFEYNVASGLAPIEFGAEPWYWFLLTVGTWLGYLPCALVVLGLVSSGRRANRASWMLVALTAGTMLAFLSALPHKEARFTAQIMPLLALFAGLGGAVLADWVGRPVLGAIAVAGVSVVQPALATTSLDVRANTSYVDGTLRAAELRPGGTLGTIPWLVARPYAGTRLTLERMDRKVWEDPSRVARTIEQSDFLLFPEYWLYDDRAVRRLVDAGYRTIEAYPDGVVLLQSRRLDEPARRRGR